MLSLKIAKLKHGYLFCLSYLLLAIYTQAPFSKCDQVGFNLSNKVTGLDTYLTEIQLHN